MLISFSLIGLYYFNARWYDASIGRFTSVDPARDGVNWYVYGLNNPLRFIDPSGNNSESFQYLDSSGDYASDHAYIWNEEYEEWDSFQIAGIEEGHVFNDDDLLFFNLPEGQYADFRLDDGSGTQFSANKAFVHVGSLVWNTRFELAAAAKERENIFNHIAVKLWVTRKASSSIISMIPGIGDLKDVQEILTGYDFISGESISWGDRGISLLAAALPIIGGGMLRNADEAVDFLTDTKKLYNRPSSFRRGVKDKTWNNAIETTTGRVRDPKTGQFMSKNKPWDMGHKPGYEFKKHKKSATDRGITREQFLNEHNNPDHYRPELPSSNRSHALEDVTDTYFGN